MHVKTRKVSTRCARIGRGEQRKRPGPEKAQGDDRSADHRTYDRSPKVGEGNQRCRAARSRGGEADCRGLGRELGDSEVEPETDSDAQVEQRRTAIPEPRRVASWLDGRESSRRTSLARIGGSLIFFRTAACTPEASGPGGCALRGRDCVCIGLKRDSLPPRPGFCLAARLTA